MTTATRPTLSMNAGVHEVFEPILLAGDSPQLVGKLENNRPVTRLKRGRRPDGSLYDGPLILVEGATGAKIDALIVEGGRFAVIAGQPVDERHPLTSDRSSPRFPCGRRLPAPQCYDRSNFSSTVEADVVIRNSSDVEISDVIFRDPVRIGLAVARGCARVRLRRFAVERAGDYGVWIGAGVDPAQPRLPLDPEFLQILPRDIAIEDGIVERCGAAGIYLEGINISLARARLIENSYDCPYDDEGGQLTITYRAAGVQVSDCIIFGAAEFVRKRVDGGEALLGAFGVEACGSSLSFENSVIAGNAREGVQILGARGVRFSGTMRVINNHMAQHRHPSFPGHRQRQNISITTTAEFAAINAFADDITLDDVVCENGLIVWSDGHVPGLTLNTLIVRNCNLSGPDHSGVVAGANGAGQSLRGANWQIEERR